MAVSHRGAISFGLVHIPVGLYTATQDNDIHFNQLCPDGSRVRYKKVCASCGKEVSSSEIIKGFEYEKDKFVTMTDEDFEKAKTEKDRSIQILQFSSLADIPPIYYDKTYHALPESGGDKAFELLRRAMLDAGKVGIAKTVLGSKETLLALIPTKQGILVETMFFADEIKAAPKEPARPQVSEAELNMAAALIQSMDKPFDAKEYHDEYQERLREIIAAKIAGKEVVAAPAAGPDNVIDLMEALKASVERAQPAQTPPKTPSRRRKQA
jgi:DNA end-binding protein Ku